MKSRILYISTLVIISGLISCHNSNHLAVQNNDNFSDTSIAVISDTNQTKFYIGNSPLWIPTQNQIYTIDSIMRETTKDSLIVGRILDFDRFYKQYICYKDTLGDSIIYISGFCHIPSSPEMDSIGNWRMTPHDWKRNFLRVDDGGPCFWQMKINLTRKKYFNYMINGYA
jgi:hypothetical protein